MSKPELELIESSLSPLQRLTAVHCAFGLKPSEIEAQFGVPRKTIHNWLNNDEFKRAVNYHVNNEINRAIAERERLADKLRGLGDEAIDELKKCVKQSTSWSVKGKACIDVLHQIGIKPPEKSETDERVTELRIGTKREEKVG